MIILSFDVGIKNMAYCIVKFNEKTDNNHTILKWGIINCAENILNNNLKCCVSRKGILCNKDACNQVSINDTILGFCNLKTCQKELNTNYSNKNIKKVTKKTTKDISLKDLGDVLFNELNNIPLTDIDCIVIENQPALKNPTMKSLQIMLFSFFLYKKPKNNPDLVFFNASNKLKIYTGPEINTSHIKNKYNKRKFKSIQITEFMLEKYNIDKLHYFKSNTKKDDLSDCYMQCLTYYYYK